MSIDNISTTDLANTTERANRAKTVAHNGVDIVCRWCQEDSMIEKDRKIKRESARDRERERDCERESSSRSTTKNHRHFLSIGRFYHWLKPIPHTHSFINSLDLDWRIKRKCAVTVMPMSIQLLLHLFKSFNSTVYFAGFSCVFTLLSRSRYPLFCLSWRYFFFFHLSRA